MHKNEIIHLNNLTKQILTAAPCKAACMLF